MQTYFDIISGANREWYATLARAALRICSVPYGIVSELRNFAFDYGLLPVQGVTAPVVSIGNITTGGTGKTPVVAWTVNWLTAQGWHPAIISRGYRSLDGDANDEKRLLDQLCPGAPHLQSRRRFEAAQQVIARTPADIIVLDDGFQHRQLHRDFDIVLIDALQPWGGGALLPRGLLRERCSRLNRADLVLITRCELAPPDAVVQIRQRIAHQTDAPILRTAFVPQHFVNFSHDVLPLDSLTGRRPFAFCGIGNPEGFLQTLQQSVPDLPRERFFSFPDHYHYQPEDLRFLARRAVTSQADLLLTTRKDLVKIRQDAVESLPVWALEIGLTFLDDPAPLTGQLRIMMGEPSH